MSGLNMLLLASLVNIFMGSAMLFNFNLYLGIAIFSGFILYDTQLIVEKHINGDNDYVWYVARRGARQGFLVSMYPVTVSQPNIWMMCIWQNFP